MFALVPDKGKTIWTAKLLHSFWSKTGCTDGSLGNGLNMDASGKLYGTTYSGGVIFKGEGVVYELTPNAAKTTWTENVLYNFCPRGQPHCPDGAWPLSSLTMDKSGNLYGTATAEGIYPRGPFPFGGGTVFELIANATKTKWAEKVLYRFCARGGAKCTDGTRSLTGLVMDKSGNLYGTTSGGGGYVLPAEGGTVFELMPNAAKTVWHIRCFTVFA